MPKIRDLGINVVPVTMRPTEIGGGAADMAYEAADPLPPEDPQCCPTDLPNSAEDEEEGDGPTPIRSADVHQLREHLRQQVNA